MTYIKHRKIYSCIVTFSLMVLLSLAPAQRTYANDISFGANNSLNGIMVKTLGVTIGLLSAIGFSNVKGAYDAYDQNVVQPIVKYLKKYEVADGKMKAYYKDGKTYVDKDVVQGVVDYATEHNMFTNIYSKGVESLYDELLEADGFFDSESFFMGCPYYGAIKSHYGKTLTDMIFEKEGDCKIVPFYMSSIAGTKNTIYIGGYPVENNAKYIKIVDSAGRLYIDSYREDLVKIDHRALLGVKVEVNSSGLYYYDKSVSSWGVYSKSNYRIGLKEIKVREPICTVADPAIAGQQIDNWNPAWANNVIDILKDLEVNTSIDAGAVAGADEASKGLALPVTLPRYGIDADTDTEAWERTASIGMDVAQTGEVALSPSAIAELSRAIAEATGEAVHDATGDISVSIPEAKYKGLDDYKLVLTDVFPFCIPFDLIDLVKVFSAAPKAPKFSLPIKYPTGFNSWDSYDLEIDLSVFDGVAQVVRKLETILFILGLIKITRSSMIRG